MIKAEEKITLVRVDDGKGGKSAYEAAVEAGYTGTEEQFNSDLVEVPNKASITQVTMIQERVNSVEGIVDTLETNVGDLGTRITTIQGKVEQAEQDIAEITISAEQARADAQAANQSATEAKTAATEAKTSAQQAIADAATAQTAAETAQTAAETAQSSANTALTKAEQAITDAQSANQSAQQAKESADSAKADAETAKSSAQSAIDSAAGAALAAQTAQDAAEAAQGELDLQKSYFWHDNNGSHVLSAEHGFQTDMKSTGFDVVDMLSGQSVAFMGIDSTSSRKPYTRIGRADKTTVIIDEDSFDITGPGGNTTLNVAHIGIGPSGTSSSSTPYPYYSFGTRNPGTSIEPIPTGEYTMAFGVNNGVSGRCNCVIGEDNLVYSYFTTDAGALATGHDNYLEGNGLVVGEYNTVGLDDGLVVGAYNTTKDGSTTYHPKTSAIIGRKNTITSSNCESMLIIGENHGGSLKPITGKDGLVVGNGCGNTATASGVIGLGDVSGDYSLAIGSAVVSGSTSLGAGSSDVSGDYSLSVGYSTKASAKASTALGEGTTAQKANQTIVGMYNVLDTSPDSSTTGKDKYRWLFAVGNGTSDDNRSNAFTVNRNGECWCKKLLIGETPFSLHNTTLYPIGFVLSWTKSTDPGRYLQIGTWTKLGTQTIGTKTVYYWERTA